MHIELIILKVKPYCFQWNVIHGSRDCACLHWKVHGCLL